MADSDYENCTEKCANFGGCTENNGSPAQCCKKASPEHQTYGTHRCTAHK